MIDLLSVAVGVFCGGCLGFIAGKLSVAGRLETAEWKNNQLRYRVHNLEEDLLLAQKERLNLAATVAHGKPKRDKRGRFISKNKEKK